MNPLFNEWFSTWMLPYLVPFIKATMYDEKEIEKRIKYMKGVPDGKQGNT